MKVHHCQVCFGLELRRLKATNPGILEPAWMEGHRTLAGIVSGWWGTVCVFLFSMVVMCMGEGRLCFSFSSFFHQCDCVEGQMSVSSLYSFTHSSHGRDFSGRGGWERQSWKPRVPALERLWGSPCCPPSGNGGWDLPAPPMKQSKRQCSAPLAPRKMGPKTWLAVG